MKSLDGLRWTLKSTRPLLYASSSYIIATAQGTLKSSGQAGLPRWLHSSKIFEWPVKPSSPTQHVLSQPMRSLMRQIPHPVVVITTLENAHSIADLRDGSKDQLPPPVPRAMTVSSFTSLSIDPVPRVTFNVSLPSTTYQALMKCGRFNAHILSSDDHGARIADLFTRGNRPPAAEETTRDLGEPDLGVLAGLEKLGVRVQGRDIWQREWEQAKIYKKQVAATGGTAQTVSDVDLPPSGTLPVLQGQGVMHVLKCEYRHLSPPVEGDFDHHAIVIGEVVDIISGESEGENSIALAYADRAYRRIGQKLLDRPTPDQENPLGKKR
ncbi:flavin reductase like domain-containing protein [Daldinia caldariorum]|uniref:flavin reductase like domain-containing protein n=1 Tax=Daldinia caldariorum TaxID=326644 RepID=UPI002007EFB9|nr:flavin reductase like domain-containing protein [Daldinia caldariorum]KAI1463421.1 flavin reductase like domain-containing protein [Daldinia caldariorum]